MSVDPIAISRSALDVEWQRLQTIAQNIANESSVQGAGGRAYRPMRVDAGPAGDFSRLVSEGSVVGEPKGVRIVGIEAEQMGVKRVYDPVHPQADGQGFVTYPDIDHASQMALLVQTARAYESNLTVFAMSQQMMMRAVNMGNR